ncbi:MAG TPA: uracil-DNA glycosylase [Polyangiaceae bacterium]|jgi:uracil-DNA glycosylase family 4|nr:uracil-DNA glycosylase [Polyangiaceae bacterium]
MTTDDPRAELASLAASLRVYLEWHQDSGTSGFTRRARSEVAAAVAPAASMGAATEGSASATPSAEAAATALSLTAPSAKGDVPKHEETPVAKNEMAADARHTRLPLLAAEVASCTRCALAPTRTQTVFARGNPDAALAFVGEGPGADEDAQGLPFVGRAGQLLDRMIAAMGLSPQRDVYVCNIVKCRPPGNRKPEPEEMAACMPYLQEQLALVHPRVIVALGNTAVGALLDTKLGITKIRGQWKLYRGHTLVMPTYHPSYLLRPSPQQIEAKREAWQDLQLVMKELGLAAPRS